ncbi:MAG: hypothetical protein RXO36_05755 [Candidatus Nanopusillus acidilobi]
MKTLEEFFVEEKQKEYIVRTKREYTEEDLPYEIRKNIKRWLEKVKKMDLTKDQEKLIELIEEGANLKIQRGKKKDVIEIVPRYSPYLILQLYKSLQVRK